MPYKDALGCYAVIVALWDSMKLRILLIFLTFLSSISVHSNEVVGLEEKSAEYKEGFEIGVKEAQQEIESGEMTIYMRGLIIPPKKGEESVDRNINTRTGLPFKIIAGCVVTDSIRGRMSGHNSTIREHVK